MNTAHLLGKSGEKAAVNYLKSKGYRIRHLNWRHHRIELDIIAETAQQLVVIEVKSRHDLLFIHPSEAVDWRKVRHIVHAAHAYVLQYNIDKEVRFDIIAVIPDHRGFAIDHIEDAFIAPLG